MQPDTEAIDHLRAEHGDAITGPHRSDDAGEGADAWVGVVADKWPQVARSLRDAPELAFDYLNDLCVVDYLAIEKKFAKQVGEERLEVVYQLSSLARKKRLTVKVTLPREVDGDLPQLASASGVWATAEWHEREAYDLFGVRFTGHPNLTRLLCAEGWEGHPLRKDYEQPLEFQGIRGR